MRLSFSTLGCPEYDLDQVIQIARQCGYDGVEIRMIRGESALHTLDEFSPREIGHTREKFNKHGLEVVCISTGVRFTSLDPEEFRKQQDLTKLNVDIAAGLGARFIRVFGGPIPEDQDREETFKRIREGLAYAAQVGESRGVRVLLEPMIALVPADKSANSWGMQTSKTWASYGTSCIPIGMGRPLPKPSRP